MPDQLATWCCWAISTRAAKAVRSVTARSASTLRSTSTPAAFKPAMKRLADALFPPVDFQKNNLRNLFAVSLFTVIDIIQKIFTGQTSNMAVVLRKPV